MKKLSVMAVLGILKHVDIIKEDPRWVKGTVKWHGVFQESARYYLKRDPKWSQDYKVPGMPER